MSLIGRRRPSREGGPPQTLPTTASGALPGSSEVGWVPNRCRSALQGMSVDPSLSAPWRYCPQSHRQSSLPITMTVKPTAASRMEYGGS
jgi:hypothetical protein